MTSDLYTEVIMITYEQIRERLAAAIRESGLTQTEIARRLGVTQATIAQYLAGRTLPAPDTFANLCKILDVDANYILCQNENEDA